MKIIIFAGGSGTRFWPISRNELPKQFIPIIDGKSTLEMHLDNLVQMYGWTNIFIPTTESLAALIKGTFPKLPLTNLITEPVRRDLGPAVGLAMIKLRKMGDVNEPVALLWSDSFIGAYENFLESLRQAERIIKKDPNKIMFLGEKPHFPNENIGWIEVGNPVKNEENASLYELSGFRYRPELDTAKKWHKDGKHLWNTGYFVTTPKFILDRYEILQPEMYNQLSIIEKALDTDREYEVLQEVYPQMESIHFDNAILEFLKHGESLVMGGEYRWNDPGTLYAYKQFRQKSDVANVEEGLTFSFETSDSLLYNSVKGQLLTTIGLDGFIVVNTKDALLVCPKERIGDIKKMLQLFPEKELGQYL